MTVLDFPLHRVKYQFADYGPAPATVIVLPVVRIERCDPPDEVALLGEAARLRCREAFDEMGRAFLAQIGLLP